MSVNEVLHTLGSLALYLAAFFFICFVVFYALLTDWRATRWGRAVMRFHACLALTLMYIVIATIFGPLPGREWIRLIIYGAFALLGAQQLGMMISEQVRARRRANEVARAVLNLQQSHDVTDEGK